MTQKAAKKKSKKNSKSGADASVLGSLRSTRPTRLGGERRGATTRRPAKRSTPKPAARKAAKRSPTAATQSKATAAHRPAAPPPPPPGLGDTGIVTTAVQAAGELAQIGATVSSQLLKRAARRIPRP
jgi:hypothetical protein